MPAKKPATKSARPGAAKGPVRKAAAKAAKPARAKAKAAEAAESAKGQIGKAVEGRDRAKTARRRPDEQMDLSAVPPLRPPSKRRPKLEPPARAAVAAAADRAAAGAAARPADQPPSDDLQFHPLADAFPLITGEEFKSLVEDVRVHGVREPVVLFEGKILDGRNRWRAARAAGVDVRYELFSGSDPVSYVVSLNLRRRHLNESQRAMVAVRLEGYRHGGARRGAAAGLTREAAAGHLNVSSRTVTRAAIVRDQAAPELQRAVDRGEVAVSTAAEVASLPAQQQTELVARGEKEIVAKAKEIRADKVKKRREQRRDQVVARAAAAGPLPEGRAGLIYADPPWRYEFPPMGFTERSIEAQYETMPLAEILALPVHACAADDCVLALHVPASLALVRVPEHDLLLVDCVLRAWGDPDWKNPMFRRPEKWFSAKSQFVWDKVTSGTGSWTRGQHELLIIATRGDMPPPDEAARYPSVYCEKGGEHSAKPLFFYEALERMFPRLTKLELFARDPKTLPVPAASREPLLFGAGDAPAVPVWPRRGWTVWGRQAVAPGALGEDGALRDARGKVMAEGDVAELVRLAAVAGDAVTPADVAALLVGLRADKLVTGATRAPRLTKAGRRHLDARRAEKAEADALAALPNDIEALIADYRAALRSRHDAIVAADPSALTTDAVEDMNERLVLLQTKANGGNDRGAACDDSPAERLRAETAAAVGEVPMWGQRGMFRLEIDGVPYLVSHDEDMSFDAHAEAADKPFISKTGVIALGWDDPSFGCTVADQAAAYIREILTGRVPKGGWPMPSTVYRLPDSWAEASNPVADYGCNLPADRRALIGPHGIVQIADGYFCQADLMSEELWPRAQEFRASLIDESGMVQVDATHVVAAEQMRPPEWSIEDLPPHFVRKGFAPAASVTADELVEYKALFAIASGIKVQGPLVDRLRSDGLVFPSEDVLTEAGVRRAEELCVRVRAAETGDDGGVRVKPAEAAA